MKTGSRLSVLVLSSLATCGLSGCGDSKSEEQRRAEFFRQASEKINLAAAKTRDFDFDGAEDILDELQYQVEQARRGHGPSFADAATEDKLLEDIDAAFKDLAEHERVYRKKTREGWKVIAGELVSPEEQARAIAERERKEREAQARAAAAEKARQQAAARERERRLAEARAEEERTRQLRERQEAQSRLADATKSLPALHKALDSSRYLDDRVQWMIWYLSMKMKMLGGTPDKDPEEYLVDKAEVMRRIRAAGSRSSPILIAHRDEIMDFVSSVDWDAYIADPEASASADIPVRFAVYQDQLVLLLGTFASDNIYNNVNHAMNTAKKRAASFVQKEVLPVLLRSRLTERLKAAEFGYMGLIFAYGNNNFVRDESHADPELLCLVIAVRDYAAFVNRTQSQEALIRNSAVFLASGSSQFVLVELELK